jgi:hypothetical protein
MAKAKCVHLVRDDSFPNTLCGVNTNEKRGAVWSMEEEDTTCKNCVLLRDGKHMGAPPPKNGGVHLKEKERVVGNPIPPSTSSAQRRVWKLEDRDRTMTMVKTRLVSARQEVLSFTSDAKTVEELTELMYCHDNLDAAISRLEWAIDQTREGLRDGRDYTEETSDDGDQ